MTLSDFYAELQQQVAARAQATSDYSEAVFGEIVTDALTESGAIHDFNPCAFNHPQHRGMRVDGYCFVDNEPTIELFVIDYRAADEPETLQNRQAEQAFKRVESFFERASKPGLARELEVSSPAWGLAQQLEAQAPALKRVEIHLISNAALPARVTELPTQVKGGREWVYRVWDLLAISRTLTTGEPEEIEIDFTELFGQPLPCFAANEAAEDVTSYLAVIPGEWLVAIYGKYGGRLLEQNVRTFLQARTKINRGIRKTILEKPSMFFAFNNGISATASGAESTSEGPLTLIKSIRHLQIVNGAQTTASLFNVAKKDRDAHLECIRVPMKLSLVKEELVTSVVPLISEYANSQNKISEADFFSNHPFHVRLENISRHLWAPAREGSQLQTKWFYERARGQYVNDQAYLTPAQKRTFVLQTPRSQVITKTDLAKCVMTFKALPHVVSLGAQKNFAKFAESIAADWREEGDAFGEGWFKTAIGQVIIFRAAESLVLKALWYAQGYRAQVVTYSLARLVAYLEEVGESIDFERIWRRGSTTTALANLILKIGEQVQERIIAASRINNVSNVTEWCKKKACWDDILAHTSVRITDNLSGDLISRGEATQARRDDREGQKLVGDIEVQTKVFNKGADFWRTLMVWGQVRDFSPGDLKVLKVASGLPKTIPTPAQSRALLDLLRRAEEGGFSAGER